MKKLNTNSITNDSPIHLFFQGSAQHKEEESNKKATMQATVLVSIKSVPQTPLARPQEPARKPVAKTASIPHAATRRYVRRTFDLFEDQLAYLTRASLEERLAGGEGSMNAMVREAIDAFIEKRRKK